MVAKILDGGGISRPFDTPDRTMISHASARPTGSNSPSAGRVQRRSRPVGARAATGLACSSVDSSIVMAIAKPLPAEDCKLAKVTLPSGEGDEKSIRRQRNLVVDQGVER